MMARIRKALDENQKGFTLVELLVVVIIIGILAAIAIPVYLGQSAKAQESAAKSDLSNAKTAFVVQLVDEPAFAKTPISAAVNFTSKVPGFSKSADTETLEIKSYTPADTTASPNVPAAFCLTAKSVNGTTFYVTAVGTVSKTVC